MPETATQTNVRELTFGEAIREALAEEMRRDPRVVRYGRRRGRGRHAVQGACPGWWKSSARTA